MVQSKHLLYLGVMMTLGIITACQSTQAAREFPQVPSYALPLDEKTVLGDALRGDIAANPGMSGFRVMKTGTMSYRARLAIIQAAEKTLDLQYFSINDDVTSNLLLEAVLRAAERQVRIRLLIDGVNIDQVAETFSVLDEFKNVEIRVFNPMATRDDGFGGKVINVLTDLDGINRRMHNKSLITDNQVAIIGGRNLGDEYFEENTDVAFKDIDVLAAGPIVQDLSRSFDDYWNHAEAKPIGQLVRPKRDARKMKQVRAELAAYWDKTAATENGKKLLGTKWVNRLRDADVRLTWARAEMVADAPHKVEQEAEDATSRPLRRLNDLLKEAKSEFIAVSPYFVPRDQGVSWLRDLVDRGLKVRLITNSLASTDVVAVHTGYRRYREDVVKAGVELYEMKPIGGERPPQRLLGRSAPAAASLHAKIYIIDRAQTLVGSANLDPRSLELNTEMGVVIHSAEIAADMVDMFEEVTDPETSYRVVQGADGGLVWQTEEKGQVVETTTEPIGGIWRKVQSHLMAVLPIEDSL